MNLDSVPPYIASTNMVVPIANITVMPFLYMAKEAILAVESNLTFVEKILLCLCLYNLIMLFVSEIDALHERQRTQERLERIEKDVAYIKKTNLIRDHCEYMWSEEIKQVRIEQAKIIREIEQELNYCKEKMCADEQTLLNRLKKWK